VSAGADRWIRWTTIGCVALLALIAGTVSYLHMLVARHGQPGWVAALTPLSVDGMIVAASTTLLADSRSGGKGGTLPWALLVAGSVASLAANVAVAQPTLIGRVIAAWPPFALTASYELLTRQVRCRAADKDTRGQRPQGRQPADPSTVIDGPTPGLTLVGQRKPRRGGQRTSGDLARQAWQWALANRDEQGTLPSGGAMLALTAEKSGGADSSRAPAWPVRSAKANGDGGPSLTKECMAHSSRPLAPPIFVVNRADPLAELDSNIARLAGTRAAGECGAGRRGPSFGGRAVLGSVRLEPLGRWGRPRHWTSQRWHRLRTIQSLLGIATPRTDGGSVSRAPGMTKATRYCVRAGHRISATAAASATPRPSRRRRSN
jgi:hypothetical protein